MTNPVAAAIGADADALDYRLHELDMRALFMNQEFERIVTELRRISGERRRLELEQNALWQDAVRAKQMDRMR